MKSQTLLNCSTYRVDDNYNILCRTQPKATRRIDSEDPRTPTETVACTKDHSVEGTCKDKERTEKKTEDIKKEHES